MKNDNFKEQFDFYAKQLRLPSFRKEYQRFATLASEQNKPFETYLLELMTIEYQQRKINRHEQRIKRANFPYVKHLEDLDKKALPTEGQEKLDALSRLDFIAQGRNVVLAGNPGTGKTHMAIGLAIKACQNDYTVLFTTVPRLITQINEARSQRTLRVLEHRFEKYDLVVCDEFGYVSFDKAAAELLFTHLSLRAGRKSTIITTNLGFDRWIDIFSDRVLTTALVDRIIHRAILVNMIGESYRLKHNY